MAEPELLAYVNPDGSFTGETEEKYAAHHANTRLHAAFSCYVFNNKGEFLVTQRAFSKKVWPEVWTNSCCGHPFPDESREDAIVRRTQYELGLSIKDLKVVLPEYTYKTQPYKGIIEHEYCPVFFAKAASEPVPNPEEVEAYPWMDWADFVTAAESDGSGDEGKRSWMGKLAEDEYRVLGIWSWWCKDQLEQLKNSAELKDYTKS